MPPKTYTGRIVESNAVTFPRRRRPLVRGRLRSDNRFGLYFFEMYTEPGQTFNKNDRVVFEVDDNKKAINIRRQKFI